MALARSNEFDTGTVLTETKIEGEFDNIYNNSLSLISPLTGALDTGATGQIIFPATQTASAGVNTLDDYEEGTWTPVLTFTTPGNLSVVYSSQFGKYRKVGDTVTIWCNVQTSTFTHTTASGSCQITGLPFASVASYNNMGALYWSGITKATYTDINSRVAPSVSVIDFIACGSGVTASNVAAADMPTGGGILLLTTISYTT